MAERYVGTLGGVPVYQDDRLHGDEWDLRPTFVEAGRVVVPYDPRYHFFSPIIIRDPETQATLERDPWYERVFGRCPVIVELEQQHLDARWGRVRRRWDGKRR